MVCLHGCRKAKKNRNFTYICTFWKAILINQTSPRRPAVGTLPEVIYKTKQYLIKNSRAVKIDHGKKKKHCEIQLVVKKWLWWWSEAKFLITIIQVNLVSNLAIGQPSPPFLDCHLYFPTFFTLAILHWPRPYFTALIFWVDKLTPHSWALLCIVVVLAIHITQYTACYIG